MISQVVVVVAELRSPGTASTSVRVSVWVYGTVAPLSGLLNCPNV